MQDLERNKIFAAILVAGIVASVSGFAAKKLVVSHEVKAAGAESAGDAGGDAGAAPEMPGPILGLIASADAEKGKSIAKACGACHNLEKGGPNAVGPNLWNVLTRGRAAKGDYSYSDAMAKHKGEMWTYEELNKFIWKPNYDTPGTKMSFPGLKKDQDRANVIAYLRTLNDTPPPPPTAAEIAKEKTDLGGATPAAPAPAQKTGAAQAPNQGNSQTPPAAQTDVAAKPVTKAKPPEQGKAEGPAGENSDTTPATSAPQPQQ